MHSLPRAKTTLPALAICASLAIAWITASAPAFAQPPPSPCAHLTSRRDSTIIAFEPPSTFTICRGGVEESDVVTGRQVYFEVLPTAGANMFEFRLHGRSTEPKPSGLQHWQEQAASIATGLHELDHSSAPISSIAMPTDAAAAAANPLHAVAGARGHYLGIVTPHFLETLDGLRNELEDLSAAAGVTRQWCGSLLGVAVSAALRPELQSRCAMPELASGKVEAVVDAFMKAAAVFDAKRATARDALVVATSTPDDASAGAAAVRALDEARLAAVAVASQARALRPFAVGVSRDAATVRAAISSVNALQPGVPVPLADYDEGGNALLEVDMEPAQISREPAHDHDESSATFRFRVVDRHYLDFEAGLGITGGLPAIPTLGLQNGANVLQGKQVDEFLGIALVELEPLRIPWPDAPLSGVVRFPVLGVPLTRDPTQNFFVGGGLGWTGVGSVVAGPYLLRELTLREGFALGQPLPSGTSFESATRPGVQVGYFVSASVDLIGLFHLFLPAHTPTLDAATGREK